jgi:hypothetical protein
MSIYTTIPLTPSPSQRFAVTLDGVPVVMLINWNDSESSWSLHIEEATGAWALRGIRLAPGIDLLHGHGHPELGALFIYCASSDDEPTYESLGDTHKLYYLPRAAYDALV